MRVRPTRSSFQLFPVSALNDLNATKTAAWLVGGQREREQRLSFVVANDELLSERCGHGAEGVLNGISGRVVNVDKVQIGLVGRKERRVLGSVDGDAEQHEIEAGD
jgi:hypothetical protein